MAAATLTCSDFRPALFPIPPRFDHNRFVSGNGIQASIRNGQRGLPTLHGHGATSKRVSKTGASIVPTLDSIEEFRLLTNSFNAEYGRFSGAIVNVITKGGTNRFTSVYEFLATRTWTRATSFDLERARSSVTSSEAPSACRW